MDDFYEKLLEECKINFPHIAKDIVDYRPRGDFSIRVITSDGDRYLYDGQRQSIYRERDCSLDEFTEDFFHKSFSARLDYIMSMKGHTQKSLSEASGIGYGTISNYKCGNTKPTFYNVCKIARVLGCDVGELID